MKNFEKKKHKRTKRACMLITNLNAKKSCKKRSNQNKNQKFKMKKGKKNLSEIFNVPLWKNVQAQCYKCTLHKNMLEK